MKIVVTGALGHIGSRLVRELPLHFPGAEIVMVDSLATSRFASLFNLPPTARYRFIEADVTKVDLEPILAGATAVVHLAAITDATASFNNKEAVELNNYGCTERVAEACLKTGAAMVIASSTSVYGTQASRIDENCSEDELKPQSPYAETKLKEEKLGKDWAAKGLRSVICRYGTIFGTSPGMRFHTAVNKFCWQAVMGQPLTVWETAYDQKRPYLDLSDCVRAICFFIKNDLFDSRIYNVVTSNHTVRDVVDSIRALVPTLQVNFVKEKIMNQLSYEVENANLSKTDFRFAGSMPVAVASTIDLLWQSNGALAR